MPYLIALTGLLLSPRPLLRPQPLGVPMLAAQPLELRWAGRGSSRALYDSPISGDPSSSVSSQEPFMAPTARCLADKVALGEEGLAAKVESFQEWTDTVPVDMPQPFQDVAVE